VLDARVGDGGQHSGRAGRPTITQGTSDATASTRRPSPAMLTALLALFVALDGSAYAVSRVGPRDIKTGAVGTQAIANNSVRATDIRTAAAASRDVKNNSLTNADIDNSTLRALSATSAARLRGPPTRRTPTTPACSTGSIRQCSPARPAQATPERSRAPSPSTPAPRSRAPSAQSPATTAAASRSRPGASAWAATRSASTDPGDPGSGHVES
jgi:hypothetical protein